MGWSVIKKVPIPEKPRSVRANYIPCQDCAQPGDRQGVGCEMCEFTGKKRHPIFPYGPPPQEMKA